MIVKTWKVKKTLIKGTCSINNNNKKHTHNIHIQTQINYFIIIFFVLSFEGCTSYILLLLLGILRGRMEEELLTDDDNDDDSDNDVWLVNLWARKYHLQLY